MNKSPLFAILLLLLQYQMLSQNADTKKAIKDAEIFFKSGNYWDCRKSCDYVLYYLPTESKIKSLKDSCDFHEFYYPYIRLADSLFRNLKYSLAFNEYYQASKYSKAPEYAKIMVDSCSAIQRRKLEFDSHEKIVIRIINQFKDVGAVMLFDENGNPIGYQERTGKIFKISDLPETAFKDLYIKEINLVKKADWERHK